MSAEEGPIDFTPFLRREFEPDGFLTLLGLTLQTIAQEGSSVYVEFDATKPRGGRFGVRQPVPVRAGDELWRAYDESTTDPGEWTRWGLSVPLLEHFETRADEALPDDSGVLQLPTVG